MAVASNNFVFSLVYTNEPTLFKLSNDTNYATYSDNRNLGGEVLIAAHVTTEGVEEFVTVDSTAYLSKILYDINNVIDGHYRFELLRFPIWNIANPYVKEIQDVNDVITTYASLVYYSVNGKFYKAIEDQTGQLPTNPTYFEEVTDFTVESIRESDKIVIGTLNTVFDHRGRLCVKDKLYKLTREACTDLQKLMPYLKASIYLKAAKAKADDNQPEQAEVITRILDNSCGCD